MISGHLPSLIGVTIVINMCTFSHFVLQSSCAWGRTRPQSHTHTHHRTYTNTHTPHRTHTHTLTHSTRARTHTHTHTFSLSLSGHSLASRPASPIAPLFSFQFKTPHVRNQGHTITLCTPLSPAPSPIPRHLNTLTQTRQLPQQRKRKSPHRLRA